MINSIYSSLTKTEKKVAEFVQNSPEEAVMATITDLAEKAGVGETSVIRFCRKLGFRGYQEFKLSIAQDLVNLPTFSNAEIEESDDTAAVARKLTMKNEMMLKNTLDMVNVDEVNAAVQHFLSSKKIFIYGVGSSGITGLDLHYRLMRIGINAEAHRDSHIIAMTAALTGPGDVVFGISTSGSNRDLVDPVRQAKENGAKVICLTSHMRSPITAYADTVLLVPSIETPTEGGALSTKISQIHLFDILCSVLARNHKNASDALKLTAQSVTDKLY